MAQRVSPDGPTGRPARLLAIAREAIARLGGERIVSDKIDDILSDITGPVHVVGAGKAVGAMARGALARLGERARLGVLVGKHAHPGLPVRVAGHPFPDERGRAATEALLAEAAALDGSDTLLVLLSGGASALLAAPLPGLSVADLRDATAALLAGGASIDAINTARRHLGRALGGRLAAATDARLVVLALSDVIGDDPAAIGSGPASPDATTFADALAVARRFALPARVVEFLVEGAAGKHPETVKPGDPALARVRYAILATPRTLVETAAALLARDRLPGLALPASLDGDVAAVADRIVAEARPGHVLVAVGEPTLRLPAAPGRGGRAGQLALEVARRIAGTDDCFVALASDGSDGPTDAAGAIVDGTTVARARLVGLDLDDAVARADSHPLLAALGGLVATGPTGTNLLDLYLYMRA